MAFDFDIAFSKDGKLYENTYHLCKRDKAIEDQTLNTSRYCLFNYSRYFANEGQKNDVVKLKEKK